MAGLRRKADSDIATVITRSGTEVKCNGSQRCDPIYISSITRDPSKDPLLYL